MPTDGNGPPASPLDPGDMALLQRLREGNDWLRALLCTLARQGRKFRLDNPQRAQAVLDSLATWPWYKAGQFVFDLLEWEDFMLDGPAPPLLPTALDPAALGNLTDALLRLRAMLDGEPDMQPPAVEPTPAAPAAAAPEPLPTLEASQYLYQYVALGAWHALLAGASGPLPGPEIK